MSSIRLLKDRDDKKAGEVISVPFAVGKILIANGEGEYLNAKPKQEIKKVAGHTESPRGPRPSEKEMEIKQEFPPEPQPTPAAPEQPKEKNKK